MTKKILSTIPIAILLVLFSYITITNWDRLTLVAIFLYFFVLLTGIYFIFVRITHRFIDVVDWAKVKKINTENVQVLRKQRRAYSSIVVVLMLFLLNR